MINTRPTSASSLKKLAASYGDVPSQLLLEPVVVELSAEEKTALLANIDLLGTCRAGDRRLWRQFGLSARGPCRCGAEQREDLLVELAAKLAHGSRDALSEKTEWVLHSISCRAAIKAGDHTSPQEAMALAEKILSGEVPPFCPHGRPCVLKLTRKRSWEKAVWAESFEKKTPGPRCGRPDRDRQRPRWALRWPSSSAARSSARIRCRSIKASMSAPPR